MFIVVLLVVVVAVVLLEIILWLSLEDCRDNLDWLLFVKCGVLDLSRGIVDVICYFTDVLELSLGVLNEEFSQEAILVLCKEGLLLQVAFPNVLLPLTPVAVYLILYLFSNS